jgi:heme oxygenase
LSTLHDLLKTEIADYHRNLDELPFFRSLHAGSLPKLAVVSFLRSLAIIHAVLERNITQALGPRLASLSIVTQPKVPLLVADLEALGAASLPSVSAAIDGALLYGAEILTLAVNPMSLVGILYVLEGSQNGGIVLKQAYARCLEIPEEQLSYIGCYGRKTKAHWAAFSKVLNSLTLSEEQRTDVVRSAILCLERIGAVCAALYPYTDKDLKHHVTDINFEAGDHAIPQNPLEVDLALRAGRAAWDRFPYLALRYGDRGRRFTSSDSCWLVALTRMPIKTATKSLVWLRGVLATRGIPTIILEAHLHAIVRALAEDLTEQSDLRVRYDEFLSSLEHERSAVCDVEEFPRLVETFERSFTSCDGQRVDSAAQLIASAWTDERSGFTGALASVGEWFVNVHRFSPTWISTVNELLSELDRISKPQC